MATSAKPWRTDTTLDVLGRYVCNGLDEYYRSADPNPRFDRPETRPDARAADIIIIGGGTFGAALAARFFGRDKTHKHRILVLEAGPLTLPEHQQNFPLIDPREVWGVPWDSNSPQDRNRRFPGLAFTLGGRSLYWGGWSPCFIDSELRSPPWPQSLVDDLTKAGASNGNEPYLEQAARQVGAAATNDFVSGPMHEQLLTRLFNGLKTLPAGTLPATSLVGHRGTAMTANKPRHVLEKELEAPLAVESHSTRPGTLPVNKFSSVPLLMRAARLAFDESAGDDVRKRLMVVPHCHVIRLEMGGRRVMRVHTNQGAVDVPPHGQVFLALGTIENTRMALNTLADHPLIGSNLMAHLRSNVTIRIPRASFGATLDPAVHPELKELAVSALFVKGVHRHADGTKGHFHVQITASGAGDREKNSEVELFKKIPDIDTLDNFRSNTDEWIVLTLRGIGEMVGIVGDPASADTRNRVTTHGVRREFDYEAPRALVSLETSLKDLALWEAMDNAADAVARIFAGNGPIQYLSSPNNAAQAVWQNQAPGTQARRDTLSSTHHESGTLWMGEPGSSVTDEFGRFHDTDNLFAVGPCLLPTLGSPNPMLSGIALIRRLVDRLVPTARPAQPEAGFTYLFDGTETMFRQWQMAGRGSFSLVDGAIVADPAADLGLLFHPQHFGDFVLRLQCRIHSVDDNSGVFVRFRDPRLPIPRRGDPATADSYDNPAYAGVNTGFEVQIDERARGNGRTSTESDGLDKKHTGALYDIPTTPGWIFQDYRSGPALVPGQWHDVEVEVRKRPDGDRYVVRLDGQPVTTYVNTDAYRGRSAADDPSSGLIGLQAHSGPVAFRNIRIQL
jgi:choline dehydrogenase-like flavoprotein